jgi:hypothetical protein
MKAIISAVTALTLAFTRRPLVKSNPSCHLRGGCGADISSSFTAGSMVPTASVCNASTSASSSSLVAVAMEPTTHSTGPVSSGCGSLGRCYLENLLTGESLPLSPHDRVSNMYRVKSSGDDQFSVFCEMSAANGGSIDRIDFFFQRQQHTERNQPWYMEGNTKDWVRAVRYLSDRCGSNKSFEVVGILREEQCFRTVFTLDSVCAQ